MGSKMKLTKKEINLFHLTNKAASLVEKIRRNKGNYDSYSDSEEIEPETVKVERKPLMPPKPTSLSLQRMVNIFIVKKLGYP